MLKRNPITALFGLFCLGASQVASAGLILDNGQEWEVRGTLGTWQEQSIQAAVDTEWKWATSADWQATGLDGALIVDPDWSELMGDLDGSPVIPNAWLADGPNQFGLFQLLFSNTPDPASANDGKLVQVNQFSTFIAYRMSFREPASVPLPATLALLLFGLAGIGYSRKRFGHVRQV